MRPLIFYLLKSAPFLDIFGCARHSPNKFGSALACPKICFEIFGCARQYEQALLHSLARKLAAARHNPSKLGFFLALHKRSFSIVLCSTGALFAGYVLLVSLPRPFVISTGIPVEPQLWDNDDQGDKNKYLVCRNNYKGEKLFFRRITLVFFLFIFLVNGNLVVVDYCTSY